MFYVIAVSRAILICKPKPKGCRPEGVGLHIRHITTAHNTIDMYHAGKLPVPFYSGLSPAVKDQSPKPTHTGFLI